MDLKILQILLNLLQNFIAPEKETLWSSGQISKLKSAQYGIKTHVFLLLYIFFLSRCREKYYLLHSSPMLEFLKQIYTNHDPSSPKTRPVQNYLHTYVYYRHDNFYNSSEISFKLKYKIKISVKFDNG